MIKQLLNSVVAKYRDLSVSRRSIICRSRRLRQIIDLLATDKSRYFSQPRPIIAKYLSVSDSVRKQPATFGFPAKRLLRNKHRNSILMTFHYPDLGSALIGRAVREICSTNQEHCLDRSSEVISQENQWWRGEILTVFSD